MKFSAFLKTKGAVGAIFMGIFYGLVMLAIFLPGYKAMPGNIDKLPIAIVNDDKGDYGNQISKQLNKSLPFDHIKKDISNSKANNQLEHNELNLVIHIPQDFSSNLKSEKGTPGLDFKVNDASPTMISQSMDSIGSEINSQLSKQFSNQTTEGVLQQVKIPDEQMDGLIKQINTSYSGDITHMNKMPSSMNFKMLPMFLTLAGYVGAMIGAMQLVSAFKENRNKASKTKLFIYVQLTALIIGLASSVISLGIAYLVNDLEADKFLSIFGQLVLNYWVSFNFTAIVVFLIGQAGMILNIPILLIQTIANGATMSRDMMPTVYNWMSHISPMYYSVQGHFANIFGSVSQTPYILSMVAVGVVAMFVNIVIVTFVYKKEPDVVFEHYKNTNETLANY
ncbi:ABC transporter permease [Staphylococcus sp. GDH8C109P]|uniref:YhgE/Pip domain-containing protein n=1 Tax=Staphylococcus sp. GDH8C109P TaxID=2804088 RepID=UPI001FDAB0F7|nr:ABC transporter permease [Staphylococcus sp. GDH8C109P]